MFKSLITAGMIGVIASTTITIKTFTSTDCSGAASADIAVESGKCNKVSIGGKDGYAKTTVGDCSSNGELEYYTTGLCLVKVGSGPIDHTTYGQCLNQGNSSTTTTCA